MKLELKHWDMLRMYCVSFAVHKEDGNLVLTITCREGTAKFIFDAWKLDGLCVDAVFGFEIHTIWVREF